MVKRELLKLLGRHVARALSGPSRRRVITGRNATRSAENCPKLKPPSDFRSVARVLTTPI